MDPVEQSHSSLRHFNVDLALNTLNSPLIIQHLARAQYPRHILITTDYIAVPLVALPERAADASFSALARELDLQRYSYAEKLAQAKGLLIGWAIAGPHRSLAIEIILDDVTVRVAMATHPYHPRASASTTTSRKIRTPPQSICINNTIPYLGFGCGVGETGEIGEDFEGV